jgi:hypothetical protein
MKPGRLLILTAAKLPVRFHYPDRKTYIPRAYKTTNADMQAGLLSSSTWSFHWFNRVFSVELQTTLSFWDGSKLAHPCNGKDTLFVWFGRFQAIVKTRLE